MESNYSLSDLSAVMGNDGWAGGNSLILIILFVLIFGGGGLWGNNNRYADSALNTFATASSQNEILLGQKFDALSRQINQVGDGLCSSTYALNNAIHNAQDVTSGAVISEGRALQAQLADCCCSNKEATAQVRYDMANFASAINSNIDSKFAALEKSQLEATIQAQANQINQLALAQQMAGVVKYPMASTYAMLNNPFCACGGCGCAQ